MKIYAYLRVSTDDQSTANQKLAIEQAGFRVDEWHSENGVSGSTEAIKRPVMSLLYEKAQSGDTIIMTALDRLGRDAKDILNTVELFKSKGIILRVIQLSGLDLSSEVGEMILHVIAAVGQMEKRMLQRRTKEGLAEKRAEGVELGRYAKIPASVLREACEAHAKGIGWSQIARENGYDRATLINTHKKWKDDLLSYEIKWSKQEQQRKLREKQRKEKERLKKQMSGK